MGRKVKGKYTLKEYQEEKRENERQERYISWYCIGTAKENVEQWDIEEQKENIPHYNEAI